MTPQTPTTAYTPGQQDVLAQLSAIQEKLKLADVPFAAKHLTISSTVWFRIKSGTYNADPALAFVKLERNLRNYRIEQAQASRLISDRPFHFFAPQQEVVDAVTLCKMKPADDANRLVVYLAPTGGGKTALARNLKIQHDGLLVEGRESWRRSYMAALCDIAAVAGVRELETLMTRGEHAIETALLERLNKQRQVLLIDEGEYFGPRTINLCKFMLNQTPTVVVIFAIPQLYDWWQRTAWEQAAQLNRRAEAIVHAGPVTADDVRVFLLGEKITLGSDSRAAAAELATAANSFGHYDTLLRVLAILRDEHESSPTLDGVRQAVATVKKLLNRRS